MNSCILLRLLCKRISCWWNREEEASDGEDLAGVNAATHTDKRSRPQMQRPAQVYSQNFS